MDRIRNRVICHIHDRHDHRITRVIQIVILDIVLIFVGVQYLDHELLDEVGAGAHEETLQQGDQDQRFVDLRGANWNPQRVQSLPAVPFLVPSVTIF